MHKALNEFGGWLRVYFVLNVIEIVSSAIALIPIIGQILLFKLLGPVSSLPRDVGGAFTGISVMTMLWLAVLIMNLYILRVIKRQESDIPTTISRVTILVFITSLLLYLVGAVVTHFYQASQGDWTRQPGFFILPKIIWWTIWILYFTKSKRVRLYYGANAFQEVSEKEMNLKSS